MTLGWGGYNFGKKADFFAGGETAAEVRKHFDEMFGSAITDEVLGKLIESATADALANAVQNVKDGGLVSSTSPAAATSDGPVCEHGAKQFKSGMGKNGKQWTAWMCPAPKGTSGQCPPEWLK